METNKNELEAEKRIKGIIMEMQNLTSREFTEKYISNPHFQKGIDKLVQLFMEAKFNN